MEIRLLPKKTTKSKRNLISEIINKKPEVKEKNLRSTLSKIKKKHYLTSTDQAACFYINKHNLNINVSSIIDDVTRQVIKSSQTRTVSPPATKPSSSAKTRSFNAPRIKWMPGSYYSKAQQLSDFYGYLFIFENALRFKINEIMSSNDPNWWDTKIRTSLLDVYNYSRDKKAEQNRLPMVGSSVTLQPIDYLTLGHLEQIITKFHNEFIPLVFPNLHFFTGHMVIAKRVRNGIAHMAPSISARDIRNAKHDIDILLQHLSTI
jgi:hypothetical protein